LSPFEIGYIIIFTGLLLLIIAVALIMIKNRGRGDFLGVILLGPIPIIIGNASALKRYWWLLAIMGLAILIIYLLPFIVISLA